MLASDGSSSSRSARIGFTLSCHINLHLKARFTCVGYADHSHVAALHPPIDSLLLKALNRTLPSAQRLPTNWSTFDAKTYQESIATLRLSTAPLPLWTAESLW